MLKKQIFRILLVLLFMGDVVLTKAQSWEAGLELGTSFVAPSSFDSQNSLRTVFFTPGIYAKHHLGNNWYLMATATATRFNYYKNGTTHEEADSYMLTFGAGKSFASDRLNLEVGAGLFYWQYYLNNLTNINFAISPTLSYQITNPSKTKMNASLFVRYPLGFESKDVYGWLSAGTRIGLNWPTKNK